ncbi:MAG: hypothetical protein DIU71_02500 [Proteobacteria bacterium]|nr:MAG: hypothetical protein DIU71_02500 [Pseudomonadota bacterium]
MSTNPVNPPNEVPRTSAEWSPEAALATTLSLCEAQMESALQESDRAVDELIKTFRAITEATRAVGDLARAATERGDVDGTLIARLEAQVDAAARHTTDAVVAFQFYDKLTQRVGHVRYSLSALAQFVCEPQRRAQPEQWRRLHDTLRRLYRTEEERAVFQSMATGPLLEHAPKDEEPRAAAGSIELF